MSIRKDKKSGVYHVDFRAPSSERVRGSANTTDRKQAQEYHDKLKTQHWRQDVLGEQPDRIFEEAAVRFLKECAGQRDYRAKLRHVEYWRGKFKGRAIRSLTSDDIIEALPTHRTYKVKKPRPMTGATLNRYLATIKRILRLCVDWEWIARAPKLPKYHEPDVRVRWEPPAVIEKLITSMSLQWMRDAALLAVATGMRESEVFSLTRSQVDLQQRSLWIGHAQAKSKRGRSVPLNDDAMQVLERRMRTAKRYVFTREGALGTEETMIQQHDRRVFGQACQAAGLKDFRWHDFRHTWASWHVQAGTPLLVLKELGGWQTITMVQRYAHLAPSHVAAHANVVKFWSKAA